MSIDNIPTGSSDEILDWIYAQEQNVSITSFWDGGWTFKLGDPANGFEDEDYFYSFKEGVMFLLNSYVRQRSKK